MLSTTNPDGAGKLWVKNRFVKVYSGGRLIPPNTPMRDPISDLTRIYIPMRLADNPYLRENRQYEGMLLSQDEVTRKQWMEGDWEAGAGSYFSEFRPDGPLGDVETEKYPWARHVIDAAELKPWWYRWGGGDWGFSHLAVFHKACRNERDKRIHVYDELAVRQVGSFELGVMLAQWWLPDLEDLPDKQITKSGVEAYERELAKSHLIGPEILPRMLLWRRCEEAIRGLTEAMTDDEPRAEDVRKWDAIDGVGGDDGLDSLRHLMMAFKSVEATIPKSYFVGERMSVVQDEHVAAFGSELTDPTRLALIAATQAARYDKAHNPGGAGFNVPRAGSRRHRVN